jgi:pilus assembly protein Flp/PilA
MHRFLFRLKRRDREGQGLVEYALILVLVAIIVIAILTLFGQAVASTYCSVVYTLNPNAKGVQVCKDPIVTCIVESNSASAFSVHAKVLDPNGTTNGEAGNYDNRMSVQFYVNNVPRGAAEVFYKYCFPGGNGGSSIPHTGLCDTTPASGPTSVQSGDKVKAIATDNEGKTGTCEVTVP